MFPLENISEAMDYIEEHLTDNITIQEVSDVAHYSHFHFQRLFQMLTGTTIGDYVRQRRLSLASRELITSDIKIIELAYKYQYESPESFTRAFKKLFNVTPSAVRKHHLSVKYYPKLAVQVQLKAESPLKYRIVDKERLFLTGFQTTFTAEEIVEGKAYPAFWASKSLEMEQLLATHGQHIRIAAGSYRKEDTSLYDACIGCFTTDKDQAQVIIEATKWCVFYGQGPLSGLHNLWSRIFLEWFPKTSFQHSGMTEVEVFPAGDTTSEDYKYEVWIPLRSAFGG